MDLAAPIDGAVYGLSVTTIGQVVGSGDELMRIVPEGEEARNRMLPGQPGRRLCEARPIGAGEDRILSFHALRHSAGDRVAGRDDAIPEPDAQQTEP